eukprot:365665-Chlamydomonas_euryale.AAC.17
MHMLAASMAQLGSVNLAARKGVHQEMRIKGQKPRNRILVILYKKLQKASSGKTVLADVFLAAGPDAAV